MGEKRQLEVLLLRLVPHALREDFMTVGLVVVEKSHQPSAVSHQENLHPAVSDEPSDAGRQASGVNHQVNRFAEARFTRDWKRVECFAPEIEVEILEQLEAAVRGQLKEIRSRADLLRLVEEGFGALIDVGPVKGLEAADPAAEMRILERDYLAPMESAERGRGRHRLGRMGIVSRMQDAFAEAGVLEMLQRDLDMREFTGENDPFRVDFGFRVGNALKMFHGLALGASREPAVTLAYRYARIRAGMWGRGDEALLTAIVGEEALGARGEVASGIAMLRANEVEVRGLGEMGEIAAAVRREVGA